jgi:hypothetical protein
MPSMKDFNKDTSVDRHANQRDKKRERRQTNKLMRGNRSVFEIQKAIEKRGREARER